MNTYKLGLSIVFVFLSLTFFSTGQNRNEFRISNTTMGTSQDELPFWFWANKDGKVEPGVSFLNITNLNANVTGYFNQNEDWKFNTEADLVGAIGTESYFQINQLYAAIDYKGWKLEGGMFYDALQFGGLSSSNGNLLRSRNARPAPKIRISTSGYKPVPGLQNWLFFRFEFDEGLLNDERFVDNTHLHHKSLYLKVRPAEKWYIQMGVEHFAMWGGTSRNSEIGELPKGFKEYLRYITGQTGNASSPIFDQNNVVGNHYGTYQLKFTKVFNEFVLHLNLSHPFEDFSGMNWKNWPDNLLGLYIDFEDSERFISEVIYEFVNTRQQGIIEEFNWNEESQVWIRKHSDNYGNNVVYNSGITYHQMAMISPLFYPVNVVDGISIGFRSTRFYSHHLGAKGKLLPNLYWKGLATYLEHFGTYQNPSHDKKVLFYSEFFYRNPSFPFDIGISLAADAGKNSEDIFGAQLTLSRTW